MAKLELEIKSRGLECVVFQGVFNKALKEFEKKDYKLITLDKVAELIIQEGLNSRVAKERYYTREGLLTYKNEFYFLNESKLTKNPKRAVKFSKKERPYEISEKEAQKIIENGSIKLDTNEKDYLFDIIFPSKSQEFRKFLSHHKIYNSFNIRTPSKSKEPRLYQSFFSGANDGVIFTSLGLDNKENFYRAIRYYHF